ncbi:hypothetical protein Q8F55_003664 [Vanrija albida]|uniref:GH16 domain-containing protein n=1 Tax=Vanrija albida TaxID=181172 RepID=A0ABR3Q5N2_9TREE
MPVTYVDAPTAFKTGLAFWTKEGQPGIQAEHWATLQPGQPRNSVRISSKAIFGGGLFIIDLALMPWGCGVWPAVWTVGNEGPWPHFPDVSGTNCDSTKSGVGCSIVSDSDASYGHNFNAAGGGVFAMLWDGSGIRMCTWRSPATANDKGAGRDQPSPKSLWRTSGTKLTSFSVTSKAPSPSAWGPPVAAFDASTCNPYQFFQPQILVLNVNLCEFSYCPGTCSSFIADPANLQNTVMIINSIKVYQQGDSRAVVGHTATNANLTGAGGPVAGQGPLRTPWWTSSSKRLVPPVKLVALLCIVLFTR